MKVQTSTFLTANLGSEISQLFLYLENGETRLAASTAGRVRSIIAELLTLEELAGRTGEIEILRVIVDDALSGRRLFDVSGDELEDYFMPFSLRVFGGGSGASPNR